MQIFFNKNTDCLAFLCFSLCLLVVFLYCSLAFRNRLSPKKVKSYIGSNFDFAHAFTSLQNYPSLSRKG